MLDSLTQCNELWGACDLFVQEPAVAEIRELTYLPFRAYEAWGIFDATGRAVDWTVDFRGQERATNAQELLTRARLSDTAEMAPEQCYIYGGRVHSHFGHFIINTLPRLWSLATGRRPEHKILCHDGSTPDLWFQVPFISCIFKSLGLSKDDFVVFDRPTRLRRLIIPQTSLGEQTHAHYVFRVLCHRIAMQLGIGEDHCKLNPVYLSKTRLKGGVGRIRNEIEIETALQAAGIEILYPETLHLPDQIKLFAQRRVVMGSTGSAFHSSIFAPPRSTIICLNTIPNVNSNFVILDRLNGNDASYYYQIDTQVEKNSSEFLTEFTIKDTKSVAEDLLILSKNH